jgi:hypothetical protein
MAPDLSRGGTIDGGNVFDRRPRILLDGLGVAFDEAFESLRALATTGARSGASLGCIADIGLGGHDRPQGGTP